MINIKINVTEIKQLTKDYIVEYLDNLNEEDKVNLLNKIDEINNEYQIYNLFNLDNLEKLNKFLKNNKEFKLFIFDIIIKLNFQLNYNFIQWRLLYNNIYNSLDIAKSTKDDSRYYFSINSISKSKLIKTLKNNRYLLIIYLILLLNVKDFS